jgi:hypothetical protein
MNRPHGEPYPRSTAAWRKSTHFSEKLPTHRLTVCPADDIGVSVWPDDPTVLHPSSKNEGGAIKRAEVDRGGPLSHGDERPSSDGGSQSGEVLPGARRDRNTTAYGCD